MYQITLANRERRLHHSMGQMSVKWKRFDHRHFYFCRFGYFGSSPPLIRA